MALNRCKNGHMYSARKYGDVCPYCNTNLETSNMVNNRRLMVDDPDAPMKEYVPHRIIHRKTSKSLNKI